MKRLIFLIVPALMMSACANSSTQTTNENSDSTEVVLQDTTSNEIELDLSTQNEDEAYYSQHYGEVVRLIKDEHPMRDKFMEKYALIDIDGDGIKELWVSDESGDNGIFICRGGDKMEVVATKYDMMGVSFRGGAVCQGGQAGAGAVYTYYAKLEKSRIAYFMYDMETYNVVTDDEDHECVKNGEEISYEEFLKIKDTYPEAVEPSAENWKPIEDLKVEK